MKNIKAKCRWLIYSTIITLVVLMYSPLVLWMDNSGENVDFGWLNIPIQLWLFLIITAIVGVLIIALVFLKD